MCTYSVIVDSVVKQWPGADNQPFSPPLVPWPQVPDSAIEALRKLLEAARDFDRQSGQPDCEDPAKVDALKALDDRLADIDKRLASVERKKRGSQARNLKRQAAKRSRRKRNKGE